MDTMDNNGQRGRIVIHVVGNISAICKSLGHAPSALGLVVLEHQDEQSCLDALPRDGGGCILVDARACDSGGLSFLKAVRLDPFPLPVILILPEGKVSSAVAAMKAGAFEVLVAPIEPSAVLGAVQRAAERQREVRPALLMQREVNGRIDILTNREREVLQLVVAGSSSKAIAQQLHLSPKTVEVHRSRVMRKMQAASVVDLVRMVIGFGDLDRPRRAPFRRTAIGSESRFTVSVMRTTEFGHPAVHPVRTGSGDLRPSGLCRPNSDSSLYPSMIGACDPLFGDRAENSEVDSPSREKKSPRYF